MKKRRRKAVRKPVRRGVGRWVHQARAAGIAFVKNARSFLAGVGLAVAVYWIARWIGG